MDVLLPSFYLPPLSWFAEFLRVENKIILEQFENFPKQTFRNRANIYGANGKLSLIIPISHSGKRVFKDIEISYAENWQKLHHKSIKTAYQSSPYFEFYEDRIEKVFNLQPKYLLDYNLHALEIVQEILKTDRQFTMSEAYEKTPVSADFRNLFSAKKDSESTFPEYYQVFSDRFGFIENLSIIDLICNKGPESLTYLQSLNI